MRLRKYFILPAAFLLFGCIACILTLRTAKPVVRDSLLYHRIAAEAALHLESPEEGRYMEIRGAREDSRADGLSFVILDRAGRLLYRFGEEAAEDTGSALSLGQAVVDMERDGVLCGKVILTEKEGMIGGRSRTAAVVWVAVMTVFAAGCGFAYLFWLHRRVVRPFEQLQEFASEVAAGNLDFSLTITKNHLFGAFTECFDLMREELKTAREKSREAERRKRELVASLSHDIKTPVTSIKVNSELLLAVNGEEKNRARLETIYHKADQIDQLITNLFHTALKDLDRLEVTPKERYSSKIGPMILEADHYGKVRLTPIPECMVLMDEIRLSQVISNIIQNSYKYADTSIEVSAETENGYLRIGFQDHGPGVPEEELPHLGEQYYRGSNAAGVNGSGLGLYLGQKLMEQMEGGMEYTNKDGGFLVTVFLRLA